MSPKKSATKRHSSARVSPMFSEEPNPSTFQTPFILATYHPESLAASPPVSQAAGSNILDKGHAMHEESVPNKTQSNAPLMLTVDSPPKKSMDAVSPTTASIVQNPCPN